MQTFIMLAGVAIAAIGQKLNSNPKVPSHWVKPAMAGCGALLYLVVDAPDTLTREALFSWLDQAVIWAAALPGVASLIGLHPSMRTSNGSSPTPTTGE
jgi:hypothetical protein